MSTGSRDFNSTSDYLDWGTWSVTSNSMTIACWVYIDSFSSGRDDRFVSKADGTGTANHDWMLGKTDEGGPKLRARANRTGNTLVSSTALPTGQWVHCALVVEDDEAGDKAGRLYQDGVSVAFNAGIFGPVGTGLPSNSNPVYIGNQPISTTSAPDGRISDVAVWSRALSASEIQNLANLSLRPSDLSTGLEAYLAGGDLTDSSGNGRNATNYGTVADARDPGFGASSPSISSVSDTTLDNGQTGITITGTGFGASQGSGSVRIGTSSSDPATGAVTQTVTAWSDTSITFTAVRGALAGGSTLYLYVTDNSDSSNAAGYEVSFNFQTIFPPTRLRAQSSAVSGSGAVT